MGLSKVFYFDSIHVNLSLSISLFHTHTHTHTQTHTHTHTHILQNIFRQWSFTWSYFLSAHLIRTFLTTSLKTFYYLSLNSYSIICSGLLRCCPAHGVGWRRGLGFLELILSFFEAFTYDWCKCLRSFTSFNHQT